MENRNKWVEWAVEIQSLAQAGLAYGRDQYDMERYERLREIAAEMIAYKTDLSPEKVKDLFCGETGYQTWIRERLFSARGKSCWYTKTTEHGRCPAVGAT